MENVYNVQRLKQLLEEMNLIFDAARIVDPTTTTVLHIDDNNQLIDTNVTCYAYWEKKNRCKNCISMRAFDVNSTLCKLEKKDDDIIRVTAKSINLKDDTDIRPLIIEILSKTTQENINAEQLEVNNNLIYKDSLTKAFNKRFYDDKVYCYYGLDEKITKTGFIMNDMKKFKNINDSYGHQKGDDMLVAFTEKVKAVLSEDDLLIRIGGDEFLIVVRREGITDYPKLIREIKDSVHSVLVSQKDQLYLEVNCGFSSIENISDENIIKALADADEMMYIEKSK
jgi:putative two-component system response regulator